MPMRLMNKDVAKPNYFDVGVGIEQRQGVKVSCCNRETQPDIALTGCQFGCWERFQKPTKEKKGDIRSEHILISCTFNSPGHEEFDAVSSVQAAELQATLGKEVDMGPLLGRLAPVRTIIIVRFPCVPMVFDNDRDPLLDHLFPAWGFSLTPPIITVFLDTHFGSRPSLFSDVGCWVLAAIRNNLSVLRRSSILSSLGPGNDGIRALETLLS